MGTKDLTDKALVAALSANTPLTDEQRGVLVTVVVQRAKVDAEFDAENERLRAMITSALATLNRTDCKTNQQSLFSAVVHACGQLQGLRA